MGAGCCKPVDEFNPDNTPKEPQTKEQRKEDGKELRRLALSADWAQMRVLLRRMPLRQICSGAGKDEAVEEDLGNTALHYSVFINHLRGIRKLLRYGTPPHVVNKAGKTPLHLALETGKLKAARLLMEKSVGLRSPAAAGAEAGKKLPPDLINIKDGKGITPLLAVVAAGRVNLTREVLALCKDLDVSIDFDVVDKEGNSLVSYAAKYGWFDEMEAWLRPPREPAAKYAKLLNVQNAQGETVLGHVLMFRASGLLDKQRALELATKLVDLGALVQLPAFKERVPLINLAAAADDKELYSLMVAKGANPLKARDALGRTPLHFAAAKGARLLASELLDTGLKAYTVDAQGNTPLHLAAMRGQEETVKLMLERADDKLKALLTPNKSGLTAYHLALKAGPDERAQNNSLALIAELGEGRFQKPVIGPKKNVVDTPLLLAIQGHQDKVVRALLQKGCSPNERNAVGELPLARVMRCATAETYDNDSRIFDQLMDAGVDMSAASSTAHPLLALCKNNLSNFAQKVVEVLETRKGSKLGKEDWKKRDEKGYTPLALAAFYNNAWLVRYLIDDVGISPNDEEQRSHPTEPEVVGTTGGMCSANPIQVPGTVAGQTPLMCAAKGASVAATQLLLNRGANVHAVDAEGRSVLQHAMQLDKRASLLVAAALLKKGANPKWGRKQSDSSSQVASGRDSSSAAMWLPCTDLVGEHWPHRAVRYGVASFLRLWAESGGPLDDLLANTADDADDMPGAELKIEEKSDFLDLVPSRVDNGLEAEDEELVDDYNGEDSEKSPAGEDVEGDGNNGGGGGAQQQQPVAEGVEDTIASAGGKNRRRSSGTGSSSADDCGEDDQQDAELAKLLDSGQAETFYQGPTPRMLLQWRRKGMRWWDDFWVNRDSLPDADLEDDPNWDDKYNTREEGDEWIDEEDVEEEIWERVRAEQRAAAIAARRAQAQQPQARCPAGLPEGVCESASAGQQSPFDGAGGQGGSTPAGEGITGAQVCRASSGLAHRLFHHRLPNAAIPQTVNDSDSSSPCCSVDDGKLASGSPSHWLRRKFSSPGTSAPSSSPATPSSSFKAALRASFSPFHRKAAAGDDVVNVGSNAASDNNSPAVSKRRLFQQQGAPLQQSAKAAGPVAEGREDLAVLDVEDSIISQQEKPLPPGYQPGAASMRLKSSSGGASKYGDYDDDQEDKAVLMLSPGGTGQVCSTKRGTTSSMSRGKSTSAGASSRFYSNDGDDVDLYPPAAATTAGLAAGASSKGSMAIDGNGYNGLKEDVSIPEMSTAAATAFVAAPILVGKASAIVGKSFDALKGKLTAGATGDHLYANEEYYKPDTMYDGLPRYMKVPTDAHPDSKYDSCVTDLKARVASFKIADNEKRLEGADLRARNVAWYHKSMSPAEYPLKVGKWKSFQRMSAKAVEQARQRRPRKPGEKPQIRQKKVWFGLPPMPSRPELALTSPLVYAVRLGRVKCVEVLVQYGINLPDIPDAHGVTPLSYALYMLVKEPHNKSLQQMVDLLLAARPVVDSASLWRTYLRPRMDSQLETLERVVAEKGGEGALSKADKQTLKDLRSTVNFLRQEEQRRRCPPDYAQLFPSLMDPLVLTTLLNDVGRTTYLVKELGAGLSQAWVWMTDIPTYLQGMLEKQLGRCNSRCSPLHVSICLKKYETVRALLDLGADPNLSGQEYSGDIVRDKNKKAKIDAEKAETMQEQRDAGSSYKVYEKLWCQVRSSLKQRLLGIKRFVSSIEIPGLTRPHPWVSPLHLACRFGLADITFLLLKRGAAASGADAAKYAPKSPLEEALMYARANAQAYGTTSERLTYHHILEEACVVYSDKKSVMITAALAGQAGKRAGMAPKLEAKKPTDKASSKDPLGQLILGMIAGSLGSYTPADLRNVPIPMMNAVALAAKANKMAGDALAMLDPVKGAMKAVALAARLIIRVLLDMVSPIRRMDGPTELLLLRVQMKRPIAHCDPALACAHVMLYWRAPINVTEKQTSILMRDILDNGNGVFLSQAVDVMAELHRKSYYRWLDIDPKVVNDPVWLDSVVNYIATLKSNVDFGYMVMDTALDHKAYEKAKKKFMSEVESSILNFGINSLLPQYYLKSVMEIAEQLSKDKALIDGKQQGSVAASGRAPQATSPVIDMRSAVASLFTRYIEVMTKRSLPAAVAANDSESVPLLAAPGGNQQTSTPADEVARGLLPAWIFSAPQGAEAAGHGPTSSPTPQVVLCQTSTCDDVKSFISDRFVAFITRGGKVQVFKEPPVNFVDGIPDKVPEISPETLPPPTQDQLPEADLVKAVTRMASAVVADRIAQHKEKLQGLHTNGAKVAAEKRNLERMKRRTCAAVGSKCATATASVRHQEFAETTIFASLTSSEPAAVPQADPAVGGSSGRASRDLDACVDAAAQKASQLVEAVDTNGLQGALALLKERAGPRVASLTRAVRRLEDTGVFDQGLDPDVLVSSLVQEIGRRATQGSEGVVDIWERKLGKALPPDVREEVEKGARDVASQIQQMYDSNELTPEAFIEAGVAAVSATSERVLQVVDAQLDQMTDGDVMQLGINFVELLSKRFASSGPVGQTMASALQILKQSGVSSGLIDIVCEGESVVAAMGQVVANAEEALQADVTAVEAALKNFDLSSLAAMGNTNRAKEGAKAAAILALSNAVDRFKSALSAARDASGAVAGADGMVSDDADVFLETLVQGVKEDLDKATKAMAALADGFAALSKGEGTEALVSVLGPGVSDLDMEEIAEDAVGALGSKISGTMKNRRIAGLLTRYSLDNAPAEMAADVETQRHNIQEFIGDYMDGVELDLGVDMASLMDALDDAREALLNILEMLDMDVSF